MKSAGLRYSILSVVRNGLWVLAVSFIMGCVQGGQGTIALTDQDRRRITDLVLTVAQGQPEVVEMARDELWLILRRHGSPSERFRISLRDQFLKIGEGHHLFWMDARQAVRSHQAVKSRTRVRWEEDLARAGWFSQVQRNRFDEFMKIIASEEPITANHGVEIALSPEMVDVIAGSWDEQEFSDAVNVLLIPPRTGDHS